jgi:hypothetical protein
MPGLAVLPQVVVSCRQVARDRLADGIIWHAAPRRQAPIPAYCRPWPDLGSGQTAAAFVQRADLSVPGQNAVSQAAELGSILMPIEQFAVTQYYSITVLPYLGGRTVHASGFCTDWTAEISRRAFSTHHAADT